MENRFPYRAWSSGNFQSRPVIALRHSGDPQLQPRMYGARLEVSTVIA